MPTARDYCLGIQSSGRNLLYIINDILDISKIEAGKLEIVEENFEPETLIADVVNIAMARKKDKDLERHEKNASGEATENDPDKKETPYIIREDQTPNDYYFIDPGFFTGE